MKPIARRHILFLTPSLPYPPNWGFGIRVYQFLRYLARRREVTLLTYRRPNEEDKISALEQLGVRVRTVKMPRAAETHKRRAQLVSLLSRSSYQSGCLHTAEMQQAINSLHSEHPIDLVHLESSQMAAYRFAPETTVLLDEHNIEYELLQRLGRSEKGMVRRLYNTVEYLKFRREEQRSWHQADGCILTSQREETILRGFAPRQRTAVAPNGVDIDFFTRSETAVEPDTLVFTGLISYRPNMDAAFYFIREILPLILRERPKTVFTVVGMGAPAELYRLAGPNVVITGEVEDVRPYVQRSSAFVVPLRMGSGTRLKVLEGLAMGKAMVSTSLGCEGISVCHGEHLLIADEPAVYARAVLQLLEHPDLRSRLGSAGRELVEHSYSWEAIVQDLEAFHTRILQERMRVPGAARSCLDTL